MDIVTGDPGRHPAPAEWFTGKARHSHLAPLAPEAPAELLIVHFDAGARTVWHSHPHG